MMDIEVTRQVRVLEISEAADGVRTIALGAADGADLPAWSAGAHIDVILPNGIERQYSLSGDPADLSSYRIGVLREPQSRGGSSWIHEQLAVGDEIRIQGPRNHFTLVPSEEYLFIAGGIGVTPIIPMVAEANARGARWTLFYGGRQRTSMAFLSELEAYGPNVQLWPQDERGLIDLPRILAEPQPGVAVYTCGPEVLLAAVEERCETWPEGALHLERFKPKPGALTGASDAFEVELEQTGAVVKVDAGQSIVDAIAAVGVSVPTSCREGTCGTCETVVLGGIPDHRDSFLTPGERDSNEVMMVCCSRAKSPRLVLDL